MKEIFDKLNKEFYKRRVDLQFKVEELDKLDADERKIIEMHIYNNIEFGNRTAFKYIPYLKYYNPADIKVSSINNFPLNYQTEYYMALYEKSKSSYYIQCIIDLAKKDFGSYSYLIGLYVDEKIDNRDLEKVYYVITELGTKNSENKNYKKLYDIEKKSIEGNLPKSHPENAILGFAVGDALGVPVEFTSRESRKRNPVKEMEGYGSHHVPAGTWSDDTSMTIASVSSLIEKEKIDYDDNMRKFCNWAQDAVYTATDEVFDIGIATRNALRNYINGMPALESGLKGERNNGNGSLMRMIPVAYYLRNANLSEEEEVKIVNNMSSLTHAHEISCLGCKIYCDFMKQLINNKSKEDAYNYIKNKDYSKYYSDETVSLYSRILSGNIKDVPEEKISSSGYVLSTLEACLWCTMNSNSFEEAVTKAVNLGDDTDTVGAITGSINGIIYGKNNIPKNWLSVLLKKEYLIDKSNKFELFLGKVREKVTAKKKDDGFQNRVSDGVSFVPLPDVGDRSLSKSEVDLLIDNMLKKMLSDYEKTKKNLDDKNKLI